MFIIEQRGTKFDVNNFADFKLNNDSDDEYNYPK